MASFGFGIRIVTNHWGWTPRGIWRWVKFGWGRPISIWGVEHGLTSERANALLRRFQGQDVDVPPDKGHRIYRRRVKIGPFFFPAGMYQDRAVPRLGEGEVGGT